jgi:CRISPR/Cas system CSM-associated protein Csm3 (group 7 of RAMP superfamily)
MNLLRDPVAKEHALLTGPSIAGALRSYLREVVHGYGATPADDSVVTRLFGGKRGVDEGAQSLLIVDDARSEEPAAVEIRDGVRIEVATGTAAAGAKFDVELLQAGTTFPLRFELLIPQDADETVLKSALARALQGFEEAEIPLGARKRRGFGRCRVANWRVAIYDLTTVEGILGWLQPSESPAESVESIAAGLDVDLPQDDARERFILDAKFSLDGSLLIRAEAESGADAGHLHSFRPGKGDVPILPGTSLAGVLRHRALRIANTLAPDGQGVALVEQLFGRSPREDEDDEEGLTASRVVVRETEVTGVRPLVQTRVKIDRFTGGAYPAALFSEEPVFGGPDSRVQVKLTLRNPEDHEVGLLLLLLKDLWTGDLPVGGESSVGRGRLQGQKATLRWFGRTAEPEEWEITKANEGLQVQGDRQRLEACVQALNDYLAKEVQGEDHT